MEHSYDRNIVSIEWSCIVMVSFSSVAFLA
jgi:hypothetical protein